MQLKKNSAEVQATCNVKIAEEVLYKVLVTCIKETTEKRIPQGTRCMQCKGIRNRIPQSASHMKCKKNKGRKSQDESHLHLKKEM